MPILIEGDFTLVTKNSVDFRGAPDNPGAKGLYKTQRLHAGLICLNGPIGMDLDMQKELFDVALDELHSLDDDLTNKALEITLETDAGDLVVRLYDLPKISALANRRPITPARSAPENRPAASGRPR